MKKIIIMTLLIGLFTASTFAAELTGLDIMKKVDTRKTPLDMKSEMAMDIINKRGQVRHRKVWVISQGDEKRIMWFLAPADVKGTSYLYIEHPNGTEDMWLYLPAFRKKRRIVSSARKENFMGSDFTYEDMSKRKIEEYIYKKMPDEKYGTYNCYVVESTPKKEVDTAYSKIISWVWKNDFLPVKEEFYNKLGNLKKVKLLEKIKKYKIYWVPEKFSMEDVIKEHKTEMMFTGITVDTGVKDSVFSTRYLERMVK
ncbi:outer membrane lipoprotein-sorting protein [Candidatus Margulisiibacteriota bacterium]